MVHPGTGTDVSKSPSCPCALYCHLSTVFQVRPGDQFQEAPTAFPPVPVHSGGPWGTQASDSVELRGPEHLHVQAWGCWFKAALLFQGCRIELSRKPSLLLPSLDLCPPHSTALRALYDVLHGDSCGQGLHQASLGHCQTEFFSYHSDDTVSQIACGGLIYDDSLSSRNISRGLKSHPPHPTSIPEYPSPARERLPLGFSTGPSQKPFPMRPCFLTVSSYGFCKVQRMNEPGLFLFPPSLALESPHISGQGSARKAFSLTSTQNLPSHLLLVAV